MYWERQRGDLCRLHSLNAFFGRNEISEQQFKLYCDQYDKVVPGLETKSMDGFSGGRCIINWILHNRGFHTILIPINKYNSRDNINVDYYKNLLKSSYVHDVFEFNPNHVWLNKKKNNIWHKLDSMSGCNPTDIKLGNNGYIIVFDNIKNTSKQLDFYISEIKKQDEIYSEKTEVLWYNFSYAIALVKTNNKVVNNIKQLTKLFLEKKEKKKYCEQILHLIKN